MKKNILTFLLLLSGIHMATFAQTGTKITYQRVQNQQLDTSSNHRVVISNPQWLVCETLLDYTQLIPTVAKEKEYIDFKHRIYYKKAQLQHEYFSIQDSLPTDSVFTFTDKTKEILGYTCHHAYQVLFSNKIEFWYTTSLKNNSTPYPSLGFSTKISR
ncbi:MAG: hypothetical protein CSA94_01680 [Bacteroidetes bacterium]|nr:MAG: hypothetical protein CSA94_01680 [Bacteroidota bacterium]